MSKRFATAPRTNKMSQTPLSGVSPSVAKKTSQDRGKRGGGGASLHPTPQLPTQRSLSAATAKETRACNNSVSTGACCVMCYDPVAPLPSCPGTETASPPALPVEVALRLFQQARLEQHRHSPDTSTTETVHRRFTPPDSYVRATRSVCSEDVCSRTHVMCTGCWIDFVCRPWNDKCPMCRAPLDAVTELCRRSVVRDEQHRFMCEQNAQLYALLDGALHRLAALHHQSIHETLHQVRFRIHTHDDTECDGRQHLLSVTPPRPDGTMQWTCRTSVGAGAGNGRSDCETRMTVAADLARACSHAEHAKAVVARPPSTTLCRAQWAQWCRTMLDAHIEVLPPRQHDLERWAADGGGPSPSAEYLCTTERVREDARYHTRTPSTDEMARILKHRVAFGHESADPAANTTTAARLSTSGDNSMMADE